MQLPFRKKLAGCKLLLVQENPHPSRKLSNHLARSGVALTLECSELSAMRTAREHAAQGQPFEAAVLDLARPVENGLELIRALRATSPRMTVVALASGLSADHEDRWYVAGCDELLSKPARPRKVTAVLRAYWVPQARAEAEALPVVETQPKRVLAAGWWMVLTHGSANSRRTDCNGDELSIFSQGN